jgi:hypothetical protein
MTSGVEQRCVDAGRPGSVRASSPHPLRGAAFEEAPVPRPSAGRSRKGAAALTLGRGAAILLRLPIWKSTSESACPAVAAGGGAAVVLDTRTERRRRRCRRPVLLSRDRRGVPPSDLKEGMLR